MFRRFSLLTMTPVAAAGLAVAQPAQRAAVPAPAPAAPVAAYADLADLGLSAQVAAHIRLRRAVPLRPAESVGVEPGFTRFYIEADVMALFRGEAGMPTAVSYLIDLPNGADSRPARPVRRSEWIIFARTVPARPGELQLAAPDAQLPFSPELADRTRAVLRDIVSPDAPPAISGIGRAFHTPGTLPGTSETQIFLLTSRDQPVSITVAREAGSRPRWFVSTSEFVDAGATQPRRDTLLWYRLACFLPAQLPPASYADAREHAQAIAADYRLVREGLGPCPRLRRRR